MFHVKTFVMDTEKGAALKPLEEAAEVYGMWQEIDGCGAPEQCGKQCELVDNCETRVEFADEIADCVQACCNLAARYGVDLEDAMRRCEERNRRRGRYK